VESFIHGLSYKRLKSGRDQRIKTAVMHKAERLSHRAADKADSTSQYNPHTISLSGHDSGADIVWEIIISDVNYR
jgi:hypothetical protein